jgi:hypothetical protein
MGYSCSALASLTLDEMMKIQQKKFHQVHPSNGWAIFKRNSLTKYFYERGREYGDGKITCSVSKILPNDTCLTVGRIAIQSDGIITTFYGTTLNERNEASTLAAHEYIRKYGFPRKESISPKHPAYDVLCESPFVAI